MVENLRTSKQRKGQSEKKVEVTGALETPQRFPFAGIFSALSLSYEVACFLGIFLSPPLSLPITVSPVMPQESLLLCGYAPLLFRGSMRSQYSQRVRATRVAAGVSAPTCCCAASRRFNRRLEFYKVVNWHGNDQHRPCEPISLHEDTTNSFDAQRHYKS